MRWATRLPLLAAFGAVVLSFVAASLYAEHRLREIDDAVRNISGAGLPGIERLTSARTSLRRVFELTRELVDQATEGRTPDRRRISVMRSELDRDVVAHRSLPFSHNAEDLDADLRRGLIEVDAAVERVLIRVDAGDLPGAHSRLLYDLRPAIEQVDDVLLRSIATDVGQVHHLATKIGSIRRRSTRVAFFLDGASVLLAVVAGGLALRAVGHYVRLLRERADELDMFAGRVAHDVLSPLSTMRLLFDVIAETADERLKPALERGRSSLERVRQIVDTMLAFARAGAHPDPDAQAEARDVLKSVLDDLRAAARAARVEINVESFPPLLVACAPGALYSVLSNLVQNSIKYMGDSTLRLVTVRGLQRGRRMRVEIEDTGPGIPAAYERAIFQPYVREGQSRQPGIGLGLATVRRIVVAHGGEVGVRSCIGPGACFWLELPLARATSHAPVHVGASGAPAES